MSKISITQMPAIVYVKKEKSNIYRAFSEEIKISEQDRKERAEKTKKTIDEIPKVIIAPKFFNNENEAESFVKKNITNESEIKIFVLRKHFSAKPVMQLAFIDLLNNPAKTSESKTESEESEESNDLG